MSQMGALGLILDFLYFRGQLAPIREIPYAGNFKRHRFPREVIPLTVGLYFRVGLTNILYQRYGDYGRLMARRIDRHGTIVSRDILRGLHHQYCRI
jgi:hypothetical protein